MAKDLSKVKIGDVDVYFDPQDGGGEIDLGHTEGGAELTFEREFTDLVVDQYGNMPVDMALTGQNLMIKATLAQPTTDNVSRAIPEGLFAEQGTDSKLGLGRDAGFLMSTIEGQLRLHPRKNIPSDRNEDLYIFKAVSVESTGLAYKKDEQRLLEVTWRAMVDESQPDGQRLGRIGDADIS